MGATCEHGNNAALRAADALQCLLGILQGCPQDIFMDGREALARCSGYLEQIDQILTTNAERQEG